MSRGPPLTPERHRNIAARDTRWKAQIPSTGKTMASGSVSVNPCNGSATLSQPALVESAIHRLNPLSRDGSANQSSNQVANDDASHSAVFFLQCCQHPLTNEGDNVGRHGKCPSWNPSVVADPRCSCLKVFLLNRVWMTATFAKRDIQFKVCWRLSS